MFLGWPAQYSSEHLIYNKTFFPFVPVLEICVSFEHILVTKIFLKLKFYILNLFGKIPNCELKMTFLKYAMATFTSICLHGVFDCFPITFTEEVHLQLPWLNLAFS